jgi:phosphoserine phosphatase
MPALAYDASMLIRLAAFDLDGTLIRDRTCVEAIAEAIGRTQETAAFEDLGVRDLAGMTTARTAMAGWYRPYSTEALLEPVQQLALAPGTVEGFELLRSRDVTTAILSLTWKPAVEWFAQKLGADHAIGTSHTDDGVEHVWPEDKGLWLREMSARLGLDIQEVAAVGDSDGDREMLAASGLRIFVGDSALELPGVLHMPGADMYDVAERIVAGG